MNIGLNKTMQTFKITHNGQSEYKVFEGYNELMKYIERQVRNSGNREAYTFEFVEDFEENSRYYQRQRSNKRFKSNRRNNPGRADKRAWNS